MDSKKDIWNDNHDLKIHGFEIEAYGQNENAKHHSSGVYSVLNDEWVVEPSPIDPKLDKSLIKRKSAAIMSKMDEIFDDYSDGKGNGIGDTLGRKESRNMSPASFEQAR